MTRQPLHRRGLAPLELVLWLPVFMIVLALMVVFGNAAVWKLRTAAVARHEVWNARPPRTGQNDPPNPSWRPEQRQAADADHPAIRQLDDPQLDQPVVRGPLPAARVDRSLFDFSRGPRQGSAEMEHPYPMLGRMGRYEFNVLHPILDDQFRYWEMNVPRTIWRRIPYIYELAKPPSSLANAYANSGQQIMNAPFRRDLDALDRDEEIRYYQGGYRDFHPRIRRFCEIDPQVVNETQVNDTVDRIQGRKIPRPGVPSVAESMASFHAGMYEGEASELESRLNSGGVPPGQRGAIQQEIDSLRAKAQKHRQFQRQAQGQRANGG